MIRSKLPGLRSVGSPQPAWRPLAAALAAALALGLAAPDVHALALGRVTVQSTLGEPLRAEIDIPQITAEEAASLRASLASPEAFRAAGIERNAALANLQVSLQQRADGTYALRLTTERSVSEPFIDLILETSWSSGRIVRDYTLLLDPASARIAAAAAPVTPVAPQIAPAPAPAVSAQAPATAATPAPTPPAPAAAPAARAPAAGKVTVRAGDTAGRLAAAAKPPTVSLDQMLVAMLRANPNAFINGNVNRLKAGAVLDLPTEPQAAAVAAGEARQTVVAQSRDFNEFRRRLAEGINGTPTAQAPARQATGKLEARVQDKRPAEATPDKLTLSKGSVEGQAQAKANEDRIARERAAQDAATRLAELNKNIDELNRLGAAAPGVAAPASSAASAAGGIAIAAGAVASAPALPASAPASAAAATASAAAPALPGAIDSLFEHPAVPAAAAGLIALLAGLVVYLRRRRAGTAQGAGADSSFLESRLQPDSFFDGSGGQCIDTAEHPGAPGSSLVYSPCNLVASGVVFPVAEADVYLAYGRDLQAEEILKEALRNNPKRVAIHAKLLEIYAKRHDLQAFERLAADAQALTQGQGPEWRHIASLGMDLDPGNPAYHDGDAASGPATEPQPVTRAEAPALRVVQDKPDVSLDDLDLDLDFSKLSIGTPPPPRGGQATRQPVADAAAASRGLGSLPRAVPAPTASAPMPQALVDLDLNIPSFTPGSPAPQPPAPLADLDEGRFTETPATRSAPASGGMIDFNLSGISLDLETPRGRAGQAFSSTEHDDISPLATKLALAEEFSAIGDAEGARSLAQEVLAEASGELRQRAERLLAELG